MKELQHVDFVKQQIETLTRAIKACAVRLSDLRGQLDVPQEEQLRELEHITSRALQVWSAAVKQAEDDKQQLVNEVQDGLREISDIKEQLGDDLMSSGAAAELSDLQAPHQRTIKAWSNEVMGKLHYWRGVRDTRIQEHDQLQVGGTATTTTHSSQ
jgi:small-conductance mechanosensitive channel